MVGRQLCHVRLQVCQAPPTNEAETLRLRSIVLSISVLSLKPNHFVMYSTSLNRPVDPCAVFEAGTLHHLLNHHLCSEPMDFKYYSTRRLDMFQGEQWAGLEFSYI